MIGTQPTGAIDGVVISAVIHEGLTVTVDGKPAKPYRIGAELPGGLRLRELTPREALLGPAEGGITQRLSLPAKR